VTFSGHKSAVTSLVFDQTGQRLCSGAKDSTVIVWDIVNESGLYRLKGHKGPITRCLFMTVRNVLVTSSKDTTIKFWDLDIQHCFYTIAAHMTEVWDFTLVKDERYLVSGTSDSELRVWKLTFKDASEKSLKEDVEPTLKKFKITDEGGESEDEPDVAEDEESDLLVEKVGSILRTGQDKVSCLVTDASGRVMSCHGGDNLVEFFLVCNDDEVKKRCQKKAKKERRKVGQDAEKPSIVPEPTIQEEFKRLKSIRAGGKVRGIDVRVVERQGKTFSPVTLLTANNRIELHKLPLDDKDSEPECMKKFDHPGHRSDVRTVTFSSDNTSILSGSQECVKIWTTNSQAS
jgi:U3 small nucleolar RNA-associated protein 12